MRAFRMRAFRQPVFQTHMQTSLTDGDILVVSSGRTGTASVVFWALIAQVQFCS